MTLMLQKSHGSHKQNGSSHHIIELFQSNHQIIVLPSERSSQKAFLLSNKLLFFYQNECENKLFHGHFSSGIMSMPYRIQKSNLRNGASKEVEGYLSGIKGELIRTPPKRIHPNISQDKEEALKELTRLQKNR
ncbi:unnamed protein product [Lepeophtheirus salmonis]|uniref:(salmon louse) hypothetical protein n=1 Tax=Lepeophtheirus salmonis TaxID=72036 RepID=A0A7R8CZK9_LEPSM|nr:unnamed protein product [Lepeophtheirus salmonis]CAF2976678.1 unnamed protein product [Lepeophtheirus salmonis]